MRPTHFADALMLAACPARVGLGLGDVLVEERGERFEVERFDFGVEHGCGVGGPGLAQFSEARRHRGVRAKGLADGLDLSRIAVARETLREMPVEHGELADERFARCRRRFGLALGGWFGRGDDLLHGGLGRLRRASHAVRDGHRLQRAGVEGLRAALDPPTGDEGEVAEASDEEGDEEEAQRELMRDFQRKGHGESVARGIGWRA